MPSALLKDASSAILQDQSREMDTSAGEHRKNATEGRRYDEVASERKKPHKQSFDYIWRTGLAGGLAGCAVSYYPSEWVVGICSRVTVSRQKR